MGIGDQLIATGMARGAKARGKRVAFGDGRRIIWDGNSEQIFRGNPNIAPPGSERDRDIEWIGYHKGSRVYNSHDRVNRRWLWNYGFRPIPGEVYLTEAEKEFGAAAGGNFVLIEPNVPMHKTTAVNKDWGFDRYQQVCDRLMAHGVDVVQLAYPGARMLRGARQVSTANFRQGLAVMEQARLFIGPEGGLHHGAAAMGVPAVVIFGGWIPPQVTGYDSHVNLTGGAEACGLLYGCSHCREALDRITVAEVVEASNEAGRLWLS